MTKQDVINLRIELNKVLDKFNKTSDIKMTLKKALYADEVEFKLVGSKVSDTGNLITKKSLDFSRYEYLHGMKPITLNYKFKCGFDTYEVVGYNTRARKYPISYLLNDKPYKCSVYYMKNIIKINAPELLF